MFANLRDPASGLMHFFAAIIAVASLVVLLIVGWPSVVKVISLGIYGTSLVLLFGASAAYHMVKAGPTAMVVLRKLDHAAIYVLIAGTYTPFCAIMFSGFWRWGLLATIWSLALAGIVAKMLILSASRWLTAGLYLVMGWLSAAAAGEMLRVLPPGAFAWLVTGGIIYTAGAVIYITKALNFKPGRFGFHEVWHVFVVLGAVAHYVVVVVYVAPHVMQ